MKNWERKTEKPIASLIQEFIIVFVLFCIDTFWLEKLKILYIYPILTMIIGHALFIVRPSDKMRRKEEIHLISFQISFPFKRFLSNGKDFGIFFFYYNKQKSTQISMRIEFNILFYFFFFYIYFKKLNIQDQSYLKYIYITSYNQLLYLSILYMSSILFDAML